MQQHFESFYNFVVLNRDSIDSVFLTELATYENPLEVLEKEGYIFAEAETALGDEAFVAEHLQSFIKYFNKAISAKNEEVIDEDCMERIRKLLKTSSITATEAPSDATAKASGKYHLKLKNNDILQDLSMRGLAFSVIKDYVQNHPTITLDELQKTFPLSIQKKVDVVINKEKVQEMSESKSKYYSEKTPLLLADGTVVLVTNQWHSGNIGGFIASVQDLGYVVKEKIK
jgi:hypothetical protein